MKKILIIIMVFALGQPLLAQEWTYDLEKAKQRAEQENKKILLVFSGSDWCAPCIKLERNIWSSAEFKAYALEQYILLKADFPRKKANRLSQEQQKHNDGLAEKYNQEGHFPLVILLNDQGLTLGKTGFKNITPAAYIHHLASFKG